MSNTHLHMLINRMVLDRAPSDIEQANEFFTTLVEKIDMNILMGPYSVDCKTVGNEGFTGAVVIDTSHMSFHQWFKDDGVVMWADIYSCKEYDPKVIIDHFDQYFGVKKVHYTVFDRSNGCELLETVEY